MGQYIPTEIFESGWDIMLDILVLYLYTSTLLSYKPYRHWTITLLLFVANFFEFMWDDL